MIVVVSAILSALATFAHAQTGNIANGTVNGAPTPADACVIPGTSNDLVLASCVEATLSWTYNSAAKSLVFSGQCLTVAGQTDLTLSACNPSPVQEFTINGPAILWGNESSTQCVTSGAVGAPLIVAKCDSSSTGQSFTFPAGPTTASFSTSDGFCIDVKNGQNQDHTPLQLFRCNGQNSQKFVATNGTYLVYNDKAITPVNGTISEGLPLEISTFTNAANQIWAYSNITQLFGLSGTAASQIGVNGAPGNLQPLIITASGTTFTAITLPTLAA